jgi:hypothetical protein
LEKFGSLRTVFDKFCVGYIPKISRDVQIVIKIPSKITQALYVCLFIYVAISVTTVNSAFVFIVVSFLFVLGLFIFVATSCTSGTAVALVIKLASSVVAMLLSANNP